MKITHIGLTGTFTDNWSYQDNLLSKYHKKMGLDVSFIVSKYMYDKDGKETIDDRDSYINENKIRIIRLKIKGNKSLKYKLKKYPELYKTIEDEKPDVLFVHGCQFLDIKTIVKYVQVHKNVIVFVDNHADFSNSARNFLSRNVLHKIIWRYYAHLIEPYTTKFYGVLPARVDFLRDVYKLPDEKIDLLVMGADDEKVAEAKSEDTMQKIRGKHNIKPDDFLVVTGGKIDNSKRQTLLLMEAVRNIQDKKVKLIIFGSVAEQLKEEINRLTDNEKVQYIGWVESEDSYKYFSVADLVVFPGRHSVFWEQVVGLGIPMIVKYWEGTTHVDLGGNCRFLYNDSADEIYKLLLYLINNEEKLDRMREIAESKGMRYFSYKTIAAKALEYKNEGDE